MRTEVIMSLDEFNEFKETREQPNKMLEDTIQNLTEKLAIAIDKNDQLAKENAMYAIGGKAKNIVMPTPTTDVFQQEYKLPLDKKVVSTTAWKGNHEMRLKTYFQEYNRTKDSQWNIHELAYELSRTEAAVRAKAMSMGYKISKGFIVRKAL